MPQDALEILIIDENAIDNIVHKTLFLNCGRDLLVKDLPCAEYAIANIESRLASNSDGTPKNRTVILVQN